MPVSGFTYYNKEKLIIITEDTDHLREADHIFNDKNTIVIKTLGWFLNTYQLPKFNFENKNHYYLANTIEEYSLLKKFTDNVILCHQNSIYLNEKFFKIGVCKKENKGILISRRIPEKRIYLADSIKSAVTLVSGPSWRSPDKEDKTEYKFSEMLNDVSAQNILKKIQMSKIGIILSEVEGGNFATGEYLLCGLPVLTTPSYGGRDHYLCGANCRYCAPTVEDVKKKFDLMLTVDWDAEKIRQSYLDVVKNDRENFIDLTDKIFKRHNIKIDAAEYFYELLDRQSTPKTFYSYNQY